MKPALRARFSVLGGCLVLTSILLGCGSVGRETGALAEGIPAFPREFRGVWVATVANIDWPSKPGLSTEEQQVEMRALLDRAAELNLNAVILQVRPAADALYPSQLEPWSEYLTGAMGRGPEPFYDPLKFAIDEAHERGLELHAWFNPYRARHQSATSEISSDHISRRRPEVVRRYGNFLWLDPGEPGAADHTFDVIMDVVDRYDVDGIHFDDYFYPYKAYAEGGDPEFPDSASYARSGTALGRDDWRRQNVDRLMERVYRGAKARKPWVKFGISPFGIWRPGYPESISGFDAYSELYADARKWLMEGWVDYFTPQLYYRIAQHNQPYPVMLRWWIEQNRHGRHMWPGNFTGRARGQWPVDEVMGQIYVTRSQPGASGNVHFSMRVFMQNPDSLNEQLLAKPYATPALVPASRWIDDNPPARPRAAVEIRTNGTYLTLAADESPWLWAVRLRHGTTWSFRVVPGAKREFRLEGTTPDRVTVSAVDRNGNESAPFAIDVARIRKPPIVSHGSWEAQPPVGYAANATRRNIRPGDSLLFRSLAARVDAMRNDSAWLALRVGEASIDTSLAHGAALSWNGYRIAGVSINTGSGLGAGLAGLEIATLASLPENLARSGSAGGATMRLRIPHTIERITLHNTGDSQPLRPEDDPVQKLRGLQAWGQTDRNWWDVPYHFLIDLDGNIYEGRDYRFMGETNTTYDPRGHLLISVIGNYNRQEPTPAQLEAITDLMAWGVVEFGVPVDEIYGHRDWAETSCPGTHLAKYLDDGTFKREVMERLVR